MNRLNFKPDEIKEGHHVLLVDLSGAGSLQAGDTIPLLSLPKGYTADFVSREDQGLMVKVTLNITKKR